MASEKQAPVNAVIGWVGVLCAFAGENIDLPDYAMAQRIDAVGRIYCGEQGGAKTRLKNYSSFAVEDVCYCQRRNLFENGLITYSSIYRILNGDEKDNKKLTACIPHYKVDDQNVNCTFQLFSYQE